MATQDVKTAYETAKADIANLLGFFECELSKEFDPINWGHVGTLNKVKTGRIVGIYVSAKKYDVRINRQYFAIPFNHIKNT